jgi:hypothetical protein
MSRFTFWKGFADAAVGVILLTKPEIIYHSAVAKALHHISGLRLPNPHPESADAISAQHAVAIMVRRFLSIIITVQGVKFVLCYC